MNEYWYSPCCRTCGVKVYFVGDMPEGLVERLRQVVSLDCESVAIGSEPPPPPPEPASTTPEGTNGFCWGVADAPEWMMKCCPDAVRKTVDWPGINWLDGSITLVVCCG